MQRILLLLIPILMLLAFKQSNQRITGTVKDEKGNVFPNVTVSIKNTQNAVLTDLSGNYGINDVNEKDILVFSAVGYETKEVKVKGKKRIDVTLATAQLTLKEVVVTAYSIARHKREMAYAPSSITGQVLNTKTAGVGYHSNPGLLIKDFNTEDYDGILENSFKKASLDPLSTFSIDVDAASYSNIRRFLNQDQLPPVGAVRIEEMINYFKYDYEGPKDQHPFAIYTDMAECPWNTAHKLVMIGLQGKKIPVENLPPSNLVFLIDVSGSMYGPARLGLVQSSLKLLVNQLRVNDRISIVVYAGAAGLVLPATNGNEKTKIKNAIDKLEAGGSTAGGAGIQLAYKIAKENFREGGNNRVILCTDGDFNVGASSDDALERMIEKERGSGVFLTVLGYGMGNYKDNKMQKLADKGNGNHAYIDGIAEAKKVLVSEFGGTLFTIAKDVKLQVEFNPAKVGGYRLIGYENRMLNKEDFNDDKKDAGELGSGHTVTALYEIIPIGVKSSFLKEVDSLKYQTPSMPLDSGNELLTVKFRYKHPEKNKSLLIEQAVQDRTSNFAKTSENFRFAAAVASFGMLLRNSEYKGSADFNQVLKIARNAKGNDAEGYRKEFIDIVKKAAILSKAFIEEDVVSN